MGGFFGVVSKHDCVMDLFFGTDYHSHLGTRRGGMAVYGENGFQRSIHNIENSPFRTKFERDVEELSGNAGIGSISDNEPQPLLIHSHLGSYAIVTVGKINNEAELIDHAFKNGHIHFMEMSGGRINATELTAAIINQKQSLVEGLLYAQEMIQGSMTILLLTPDGIYASRDRYGRTPLTVGQKDEACCVSFESFAYINLGYPDCYELGPGEIVRVSADGVTQLSAPRKEMKICSFLWVYYGYPTSSYEGINVEEMRYRCGQILADRDLGCHGCSHCPGHETAARLLKLPLLPSRTHPAHRPTPSTRILWQVFLTPASPTPSAMPTSPASRLRVRSSSTPQPGRVPSCRRTRASETSSQR